MAGQDRDMGQMRERIATLEEQHREWDRRQQEILESLTDLKRRLLVDNGNVSIVSRIRDNGAEIRGIRKDMEECPIRDVARIQRLLLRKFLIMAVVIVITLAATIGPEGVRILLAALF